MAEGAVFVREEGHGLGQASGSGNCRVANQSISVDGDYCEPSLLSLCFYG